MKTEDKIPIGISTCLLGERVRFDGGHKHDKFITQSLGRYFSWVPTCPEMGIGLGTPRASLRFERIDGEKRLIQAKSELDLTDKMQRYASTKVRALKKEKLYGYILKSRSPSCGMERIKVYRGYAKQPSVDGVGMFAEKLMEQNPNLPIEEEGRLCDPVLRENWVSRVFAYYAFRNALFPRPTVGKLVKFHTEYKFSILAHCDKTYRIMGRLVADAKSRPILEAVAEYEELFMGALKKKSTAAKHVNVLEHMIGFFKKDLDSEIRREILVSVRDYRAGIVPVVVPITLVKHYANILNVEYLKQQSYLNPHPKELALRSHI